MLNHRSGNYIFLTLSCILNVLFSFYFKQPLCVFNDSRMPHPVTVQLCDKLGNASDEENVKVVLNYDRGLNVCRYNGDIQDLSRRRQRELH